MPAAPEPVSAAVDASPAGPNLVPANRRTRVRLRELCDEVLASFRVARDRDLISDGDRADAQAMLARVAPSTRN
jgi:hypothetical protein